MTADSKQQAHIFVKRLWDNDTASQSLNIKILSVDAGAVSIQMMVTENMLNGHETCHGGYIFSLADSCFAFACNSREAAMVAQQCSINYCQPAFKNQTLTANAREVQMKGRSGIYDVEVVNEDGEIIAIFRGLARQIKQPPSGEL